MNKLLLTTALLAATAGAASAEITMSGSGRFGLTFDDSRAVETQLNYRLRINVNAKFEADNGITYGGRIRFQDNNAGEAYFSPAMLYVEASGVPRLFRQTQGFSPRTACGTAGGLYQ